MHLRYLIFALFSLHCYAYKIILKENKIQPLGLNYMNMQELSFNKHSLLIMSYLPLLNSEKKIKFLTILFCYL